MPDINLLSTDNQESNYSSAGAGLVTKILGVVLIITLLYFVYLWFAVSQARKELASSIAKTSSAQNEAINRKERSELVTRQGQVQSLNLLIQNHLYWSYILPELARVTLRSSTYSNVSAGADGTLNLTVRAVEYSDLDQYLQVFNLPQFNQQFSDVKILAVSKAQQGSNLESEMRLELKFNPDFIRNRTQ